MRSMLQSITIELVKQAEVAAKLRERFDAVTPRERQVLLLATTGSQSKQIAYQLKSSENMVEVHRWQGMRKIQARSWVELSDKLGVSSGGS